MAMAVVEATPEELELEALDRLVEQYDERGVPMSKGELKRRLRDIKYKYSHPSAARGNATKKAKKHFDWNPTEGTKLKGNAKDWDSAWTKVQSLYKDYTLLPDRPGAGDQKNFRGKAAKWQRKVALKEDGESAFLRLLLSDSVYYLQDGTPKSSAGEPGKHPSCAAPDEEEEEDGEKEQEGEDGQDDDQEDGEEGDDENEKEDEPAQQNVQSKKRRPKGSAPAAAAAPAASVKDKTAHKRRKTK